MEKTRRSKDEDLLLYLSLNFFLFGLKRRDKTGIPTPVKAKHRKKENPAWLFPDAIAHILLHEGYQA
jgi:hypothetical protein